MKQMPKDTILLKNSNGESIAFDFSYFKTNPPKTRTNYDEIYYKVGEHRDTWVDYRRAIRCKSGSKNEILAKALADPEFLISIEDIPECYHYSENCKEFYLPYDGYYENSKWLKRNDRDLNLPSVSEDLINNNPDFDRSKYVVYRWYEEDLLVTFPRSVKNAIISLNMIFYHYEVSDDGCTIIYRRVKNNLSKFAEYIGNTKELVYDLKFNVYIWDGLIKEDVVTPISIDDRLNSFILEKDLEESAFIFYNGVMYNYKVSETDKKYIKIEGLNVTSEIPLERVYIHKMRPEDKKMEARMHMHKGIINRYKNSVDFLLPLANSLIIYNGIDHEYAVEDDCAIKYDNTIYSISDKISFMSDVISVNFIKG